MELKNEFSVAVPVDEAWTILTDLERIAPCLPGAQLQEVEGDEYRGIVKVKVGPITAQYKGKATFAERDDSGHRAVIRAEGRDTRGSGNASATITATLAPEGTGTKVLVVTDLSVTGKVAQFGRGVLADVSSKLMDQFVESLEADVLSGATAQRAAAAPTEAEASASAAAADSAAPAKPAKRAKTAAPPEPAAPAEAAAPAEPAAPPEPSAAPQPVAPAEVAEPAEPAAPAEAAAPAEPEPAGAATGPRRIDHAPTEPVDLLGTAGPTMAKRVAPFLAVLVLLLLIRRGRRNRR